MIGSRPIGKKQLHLSLLTLGTMRFLPQRVSETQGLELLEYLVENGVNTFHVSSEYESYPFFTEIFNRFKNSDARRELKIIAKLGCPHFGETRFDPFLFEKKVDQYLLDLKIDRLEVVQWLLRFDLKQERRRIEIFEQDASLIADTISQLRRSGKIGAMVSFPYTREIAEMALKQPECDGLALYVNPLERDLAELLDRAFAAQKSVLAIRPLAAGKVFTNPESLDLEGREALHRLNGRDPCEASAELMMSSALRYSLAHPAVRTTIVSLSSMSQARQAVAGLSLTSADQLLYRHVTYGPGAARFSPI